MLGPTRLTNSEIRRYGRHLLLPEIGLEGQKKFKSASVLLVGVGGLGTPAALYLAAAGIGRIGLVDFDLVEESNLQRQIIYSTKDVGRSKLEAAKEKLLDLNPDLIVECFEQRLDSSNALDILSGFDLVIDGTDNFATRYLVNDACVLLNKSNVYGSVDRFEGQVTVFAPDRGPCYRCLYPAPPNPGRVQNCADAGVLGVLPGMIGMLQATEAIKLLLGLGESLVGRLLLYNALEMEFEEISVHKNPDCPICGDHPTLSGLIDYDRFCGTAPVADADEKQTVDLSGVKTVSPQELKAKINGQDHPLILDVRDKHELKISSLENSVNIPLHELPGRLDELEIDREMVVVCRVGERSARAAVLLQENGFRRVYNLAGGLNRWAQEIDPGMPQY